jgi:hypothetical protein
MTDLEKRLNLAIDFVSITNETAKIEKVDSASIIYRISAGNRCVEIFSESTNWYMIDNKIISNPF